MLVTAAVTAAALVGAFLLAGGAGNRGAEAAPETPHPLAAAPPRAQGRSSRVGPEDVPMPGGKPPGRASAPPRGAPRGGVPCGSDEQLAYHVHARLTIFVKGRTRTIPLGVGIGPPLRISRSDRGAFAS